MKKRIFLVIVLVQALMFIFVLQPAQASLMGGSRATDFDRIFDVDKTAPGTKVNVTLTIYYEQIEQNVTPGCVEACGEDPTVDCLEECNSCPYDENTKMRYFMRARIGNENLTKLSSSNDIDKSIVRYPFAGVEREDICYMDFPAQVAAVKAFIRDVVVPELFDGQTFADDSIQIKSVGNIVEDRNSLHPGCCEEVTDEGIKDIYFIIMDLVLAVQ